MSHNLRVVLVATLFLGLVSQVGYFAVASAGPPVNFVSPASVIAAVKAAQSLTNLPINLTPPLTQETGGAIDLNDWGGDVLQTSKCVELSSSMFTQNSNNCYFGDVNSKFTVALVGDSRADMILDDFNNLGLDESFRVLYIGKEACPTPIAPYSNNSVSASTLWTACVRFNNTMLSTLNAIKPQVIVISSAFQLDITKPTPHQATPAEVTADFEKFLMKLPKKSKTLVLGGFPQPAPLYNPIQCLSRNVSNISKCDFIPALSVSQDNAASKAATLKEHDVFLNLQPYFCAKTCPAVINNDIVYTEDAYHAGKTYLNYLMGPLWSMLKPAVTSR
jgi:hypothetical protein